jgi:hypothetical protein
MLYRLLRVDSVSDEANRPLPFTQQVTGMSDDELWQVNQVTVVLSQPVAASKETRIALRFHGTLAGYAEVMQYVKDTVDDHYTLLRAETMPYPIPGLASETSWSHLYGNPFSYDVTVKVPKEFVVSCGASVVSSKVLDSFAEYTCVSDGPREELNIAVARFKILEDAESHLRVYALPEDVDSGSFILSELKRSTAFYRGLLGNLPGSDGMNVIEIPEGWGSYTGHGFIFQQAAAFKSHDRVSELYHEVSHHWNAKAALEQQKTRWFDEAFAMYFQALALRSLVSEAAYRDDLERDRSSFVSSARSDPNAAKVPIAEYGKYNIGQYSYQKGPWSLYVLHRTMGDEAFFRAVSTFVNDHQQKLATFQDFQQVVQQVSGRNMQRFFDEWIYGTESSQLLIDKVPIETIAARYK